MKKIIFFTFTFFLLCAVSLFAESNSFSKPSTKDFFKSSGDFKKPSDSFSHLANVFYDPGKHYGPAERFNCVFSDSNKKIFKNRREFKEQEFEEIISKSSFSSNAGQFVSSLKDIENSSAKIYEEDLGIKQKSDSSFGQRKRI